MLDARVRVAVVGATGAVGLEALSILAARGHDAGSVRALASARSEGRRVPFGDGLLAIERLGPDSFEGVEVALFCADAASAGVFAPIAMDAGALVIDNSSAFRMDPRVPLVVPEINGSELDAGPRPRLIANPNCSTIILLTALAPIRRAFEIERIVVSTYQAVSGAGLAGVEELRRQTVAAATGEAREPSLFPEPCAMNVFAHESALDPITGCNGEESKIIAESRRILGAPGLPIHATCVRVPVERAHSQAITVELGRGATSAELEAVLLGAPRVEHWPAAGSRHPTPRRASGRDPVLVGRARIDGDGGRWASLWVCGDQLRKGAALNAIQIADRVFADRSPNEAGKRATGIEPATFSLGS